MKRTKYIKPDLTVVKLSSKQYLLGLASDVTPPGVSSAPEFELEDDVLGNF